MILNSGGSSDLTCTAFCVDRMPQVPKPIVTMALAMCPYFSYSLA